MTDNEVLLEFFKEAFPEYAVKATFPSHSGGKWGIHVQSKGSGHTVFSFFNNKGGKISNGGIIHLTVWGKTHWEWASGGTFNMADPDVIPKIRDVVNKEMKKFDYFQAGKSIYG